MIRPGSSGSGDKHRQDLCNISWGTNSGAQAHVVPQAPSTLHIVPGPKPVLEGGRGSKCFRPEKGVPTFGTQCHSYKWAISWALDAVTNDNLIINVSEETIV